VWNECPPRKSIKSSWIYLGKESSSYSTVKKWAAEFKSGRESIGGDERPKEATNDETAEAVHDLVMCDLRKN
jgi:hypothetical protein